MAVHIKIDELKHNSILSSLEINKCTLLNKAYYLLECIKELKVKKIIVFLKSIPESNEFCKIIKVLNIFFDNKLVVGEINCYVTKSERSKIMTRFKNKNDTINILCNVHILDEGIDIPECDSVYLTHPNYNPINFIQRISRCNRIKPVDSGIDNIAHVIIWAKDETKIVSIDKLIAEYLKTNNEVNINNPYIRTTNIIQPDNIEQEHNSITSQSVVTTDTIYISDSMNLIDYLKSTSSISSDFIDDFFGHYDENTNDTDFVIDFDSTAKWLTLRKDSIKRTLLETYRMNIDYKITQNKLTTAGRPSEKIMLTPECFKKMCMLTKSKKGDEIRTYIIQLEKYHSIYNLRLINNLRSQLK